VERGPSRVEEDGASVYRAACQLGCEGIVSKRAAIEIEGVLAPAQARSRSWCSGLLPENYYAAPTDLSHGIVWTTPVGIETRPAELRIDGALLT
jgi:hypothetical protein